MAERRCFGMKIVDSDAFLDMPLSSQALYFHLGMRADNDGFVNNPRRIARLIGACDDDLNILVSRRFILVFDNGVVVIKHWRIQNTLRNDRLTMPHYPDIAAKVYIKANGSYTDKCSEGVSLLEFKAQKLGLPNDIPMTSQCHTNDTLIEGKGIELKRTESKGEEDEGTDSSLESDLSTDTPSKKLEFFNGTLGEGIVFMSEEQFESLLQKLTLEEIEYYFDRLKNFIQKKPEATIKSHYKTILKWVEEDRSV